MKTSMILPYLLAISLLIIAGCDETGNVITGAAIGGTAEEKEDIVCNSPYIRFAQTCCLDQNKNNICDNHEVTPEEPKVEEKPEEIQEETEAILGANEYKLNRGESVTVNSQEVKLIDFGMFSGKLEVVVSVDGKEWAVYNTRYFEIVNGLRISTNEVTPPASYEQYAILKIEPNVLSADNYLIKVEDAEEIIKGKIMLLYEVLDDGTIKLDVGDSGATLRVGESKKVEGLTITNVDSFPRARRSEEYAIIKVR